MSEAHIPVLRNEILNFLQPNPKGYYVDGTIGLGGHSSYILKKSSPSGRLIGIDMDESALAVAKNRLHSFEDRLRLIHGNFAELHRLLDTCGISKVDGVLLDLGVSSLQLDTPDRGFSFQNSGPLDMRMDMRLSTSASQIVNESKPEKLIQIFREYGEERFAKQIAQQIVDVRKNTPIRTTIQLSEIVERVYSYKAKYTKDSIKNQSRDNRIHPSTRVFQALRIEVNNELQNLSQGLTAAISVLKSGGHLCVISFHSLEDRIVKHHFREYARVCICPPKTPVCICKHEKLLDVVTSKPVTPTKCEIDANPRSRSAKLRVATRV